MATAWPDVRRRITATIRPGRSVLKCDGIGRRPVTGNDSRTVSIRTGVKTTQTKTISYEMLEHAVAVLNQTGRLTSADFRGRFGREYTAAPCRFSMTGGVLVEVGVATLVPGKREGSCIYELA